GELQLCVHLGRLLGIEAAAEASQHAAVDRAATASAAAEATTSSSSARMLVTTFSGQRWVFPVDEVDQLVCFAPEELKPVPATVARSASRLSCGVLAWKDRTVGCLDEARLAQALGTRLKP